MVEVGLRQALAWVLILLVACRGEDPRPVMEEEARAYFPVQLGNSWVWSVDSVVYDPIGSARPIDTVHAYIQEQVVDSFLSGGSLGFVVHRSMRRDSSEAWIFQKAILVFPESDRILWNEDNLTFLRLKDPLKVGLEWEATALIDPLVQLPIYGELMQPFKEWSSLVQGLGDTLITNEAIWDDVLTLRQADYENLLERRFCLEVFQRGVGLVHRRMMILDTQCQGFPANCAGVPWEIKAEKGYILEQHLISYR